MAIQQYCQERHGSTLKWQLSQKQDQASHMPAGSTIIPFKLWYILIGKHKIVTTDPRQKHTSS